MPAPGGERLRPADLLGRCTFPGSGASVHCAVSGGADSVALLVLAVEGGCAVTAVHVDHGIRPDGQDEAELVRAVAARFGAGFRVERVHVAPGPNLEARARRARHDALPPDALLGHTADDQAETVLINLLRGAGADGLAGMRPDRRPLLGLRRAETRELCRSLDLEVVADPSNDDPAFLRNRVRAELLPLLDDLARRDVVPLLARQAGLARQLVDHLDAEASALDPCDASALRAAPIVVAQHAVRRWLRTVSPEHHPPDAAAVERVLAVVRHQARATEIAGGWRVVRTRDRLRVEPVRAADDH